MMMKRSIALLSGCLMLLLTACGASTPIPSGAEPAPLSPSPKDQGVRYQAELEEVSGESREGDILLLSYRYEVPVLRAYGEDGAELPEAELPEPGEERPYHLQREFQLLAGRPGRPGGGILGPGRTTPP